MEDHDSFALTVDAKELRELIAALRLRDNGRARRLLDELTQMLRDRLHLS